jgi:hypothetical protein
MKILLGTLTVFALCAIVLILTWLVHAKDTAWLEDYDGIDQLEDHQ